MLIAGIDPGFSGAVALLTPDGGLENVLDMPTVKITGGQEIDLHALARLLSAAGIGRAFVEKQWTRQHDGKTQAFKSGGAYVAVLMGLATLGIPYEKPTPQAWTKALRLAKGKDANRQRAVEIWPERAHQFAPVGKGSGRADAALIGLYGVRSLANIARGEAA